MTVYHIARALLVAFKSAAVAAAAASQSRVCCRVIAMDKNTNSTQLTDRLTSPTGHTTTATSISGDSRVFYDIQIGDETPSLMLAFQFRLHAQISHFDLYFLILGFKFEWPAIWY